MAIARALKKKKTIAKPKSSSKSKKKVAGKEKNASSKPRASRIKKDITARRAKRSTRGTKKELRQARPVHLVLRKHGLNPIIEPRDGNFWEMKATFNPAAVAVNGRIHLLYRAIGGNDVSTLGCAVSDDGVTIAERPHEIAFEHRSKGERPSAMVRKIDYCSGGGWAGGSEDPRLTMIEEDGRIYLTYTAFDGWGSVRVALASIMKDDFINQQWRWSEPVLLSPPGETHKNWVLFPEKINGKYAILHGITPKILIEYVDALEPREGTFIKSSRPSNENVELQKGVWDSRVRGAGPPPIKTSKGWLLLYHAIDERESGRYKLGAMLLDLNDPTVIRYRSQIPILEPEEWYENTGWKSGIIYSCGAVIKDGELYVYYGGADSVVCVAAANLDHFLNELIAHGTPKLSKKSNVRIKK